MTKRIAMISEHASPLANLGRVDSGGQNVYVAQVARHLARLGYLIDIFTRRDDESLPEILDWEKNIRIIHVPAGPSRFVPKEELLPYMEAFTAYMVDFFKQQKEPYDLVHAHFWMSALVAAEIKRALDIPFIVTFHALGRVRRKHQGDNDAFPDVRFEIEDRIVAEADRLIAECPQDEEDLLQLYQAAPEKIAIVPCGFDPVEMWPMDKKTSRMVLGIPIDEHVVLQLGRIVPRKGVDTAIRGFARMVKQHHIPGRLIVVGGESEDPDPDMTPEIGRLKEIAAQEGVTKKVIFTGRRDRNALKYYYSAADVFISTPWYEPFGITPVEAMACGTPVIGSNVGGIKYTLVDGETGFLVPPNDPLQLAERLAYLYLNPQELNRMSENAIKRANEFFTWEKVSEAIANVYEELTGETQLAGLKVSLTNSDASQLAIIQRGFESALQLLQRSMNTLGPSLMETANVIIATLTQGGKVLVCGNGGSAADAQHFAAELVGRYLIPERKGLPVMALNSDTAFLTAWSNDESYEMVFSRQVEAFGQPGDLLIGISTSGCSPNLLKAFQTARTLGMSTLAFLGKSGGDLLPLADHFVTVPSNNTPRIQEIQILALHMVCELVENQFIPTTGALATVAERTKTSWDIESTMDLSKGISFELMHSE